MTITHVIVIFFTLYIERLISISIKSKKQQTLRKEERRGQLHMQVIYIQFKKDIHVNTLGTVILRDIAHISIPNKQIEQTPLYTITEKDGPYVVIDSFIILSHLQQAFPNVRIQMLGPSQCLIHVKEREKKGAFARAIVVWLILFIGTAMTIMNFHYDVSMQEVQQKLHFLLTGQQNDYPLFIQIPYSFGLGIGMLLFFNYWFRKKITEEPSPLEIELFNYQQQMNAYTMEKDTLHDKEKEK